MTNRTHFCMKFHRFEPLYINNSHDDYQNILRIEEHMTNSSQLSTNLERITSKNNLFQDDIISRRLGNRTNTYKL